MKKFKKFFSKSLYLELWLSIVVSLIIGGVSFFLLQRVNELIYFSKWADEVYIPSRLDSSVEDFQEYIDENQISSEDKTLIYKWSKSHPLMYFYLERDGIIIYNFYVDYSYDSAAEISEADAELIEESYEYNPYVYTYTITLSDGECKMHVFEDFKYDLYSKIQFANIGISALLIIVIITILVRKKIRYINEVTSGIEILAGGDLSYRIPVKGNDEISNVADNINSMSIAVANQIENEKKAIQANNSLVTALSHDLRTPLTTQMGYLEILKEHHYHSEEEMDKYVNTALDTCFQIKEMSDRLFEYFLAFDPHPERSKETLSCYDGIDFLMQIISELSLPLIEQGFNFEYGEPTEAFKINVNTDDILRIFNNVFTNIDKYADEAEPVHVALKCDSEFATLSICNKIRSVPRKNESAKIGLISINSLMKRQGGSSIAKTTLDTFTIELKFPIYQHA
ncbi:HAMP domain-containing sensor histidine kinase [Pseudobutyrivibrio ruminis]|uniref:HAMP domain-containing sensor histidine kinase n=1 Tax=Pseudobutyrivibrio ruminis TaxID=46206 RepID=UPI00051BEF9A|nr:HAMP domain-containing sensor histidine kinase [Pseudobutyrivibrio ruminis]